jgi:hypothetical protein
MRSKTSVPYQHMSVAACSEIDKKNEPHCVDLEAFSLISDQLVT